ncbi:hypothetical protein BU26DRAFT_254404 [Trematosphaeria pertusa]|uniref:Uncharacterized protein n=1 Tax=Trematosphaeria pertusa TaxID=390896 RepID=A0A6A6IP10_9PLEO|nr:uncharacterized protein BU26DRAFT_254404 [Trematosphaeria pertusa]KAF2252265.1 hypothetical protein BU26DRAFT_254404 [Trematosphaeria pertusa]
MYPGNECFNTPACATSDYLTAVLLPTLSFTTTTSLHFPSTTSIDSNPSHACSISAIYKHAACLLGGGYGAGCLPPFSGAGSGPCSTSHPCASRNFSRSARTLWRWGEGGGGDGGGGVGGWGYSGCRACTPFRSAYRLGEGGGGGGGEGGLPPVPYPVREGDGGGTGGGDGGSGPAAPCLRAGGGVGGGDGGGIGGGNACGCGLREGDGGGTGGGDGGSGPERAQGLSSSRALGGVKGSGGE